jgi:rubredoxin
MSEYNKYQCNVCGHIYDEAEGDEDSGLPPGTRWEDVPDDWRCPECVTEKSDYELMDS